MSHTKIKPMTRAEAEKAEQAWIMRMYGHVQFVEIAFELGYEGTASSPLGEVAMKAVQRFDAEIEAGLRPRPACPDNPGRGRATVAPRPGSRKWDEPVEDD